MMMTIRTLSIFAAATILFSGCATKNCCEIEVATTTTTTVERHPVPVAPCVHMTTPGCAALAAQAAPATTKLVAVGYGAPAAYAQYTPGQQQLMAMRAAQVDAYRNLAEQVYGFRVMGNTAISAFAAQNDTVRSYVDAFIRGARVVNMTTIANGNYEAMVELEISKPFLDCIEKRSACTAMPVAAPTCRSAGCTVSSAHTVSN